MIPTWKVILHLLTTKLNDLSLFVQCSNLWNCFKIQVNTPSAFRSSATTSVLHLMNCWSTTFSRDSLKHGEVFVNSIWSRENFKLISLLKVKNLLNWFVFIKWLYKKHLLKSSEMRKDYLEKLKVLKLTPQFYFTNKIESLK